MTSEFLQQIILKKLNAFTSPSPPWEKNPNPSLRKDSFGLILVGQMMDRSSSRQLRQQDSGDFISLGLGGTALWC